MTLPKFIICMDGTFRLGMVDQHKHLLKPGKEEEVAMLQAEVDRRWEALLKKCEL